MNFLLIIIHLCSLTQFYLFFIIVPADVKENLQILVQTSLATRLIEWYLGKYRLLVKKKFLFLTYIKIIKISSIPKTLCVEILENVLMKDYINGVKRGWYVLNNYLVDLKFNYIYYI